MIPTSHKELSREVHSKLVGGSAIYFGEDALIKTDTNLRHCSTQSHSDATKTAVQEQPAYNVHEDSTPRLLAHGTDEDFPLSLLLKKHAGQNRHQQTENASQERNLEEANHAHDTMSLPRLLERSGQVVTMHPSIVVGRNEEHQPTSSFPPPTCRVCEREEDIEEMNSLSMASRDAGRTVTWHQKIHSLGSVSFCMPSSSATSLASSNKAITMSATTCSAKESRSSALSDYARVFVDHKYRDHAFEEYAFNHVVQLELHERKGGEVSSSIQSNFCTQSFHESVTESCDIQENDRNYMSFPEKLYELLSASSNDERLSSVISWQPHGRCFLVRKPENFVKDVLPRYFRQSKLTSFQRQLNMYGFKRLTRQCPDRGAYYHEFFLRGRPSLCRYIERCRIKGNKIKPVPNPAMEPNFHMMRPCGDDDWKLILSKRSSRPGLLIDCNAELSPEAEIPGAGQQNGSVAKKRKEHVLQNLDKQDFTSSRFLSDSFKKVSRANDNSVEGITNLLVQPQEESAILHCSDSKLPALVISTEKPCISFRKKSPAEESRIHIASINTSSPTRLESSSECHPQVLVTNQSTLSSYSAVDARNMIVLPPATPTSRESMTAYKPTSTSMAELSGLDLHSSNFITRTSVGTITRKEQYCAPEATTDPRSETRLLLEDLLVQTDLSSSSAASLQDMTFTREGESGLPDAVYYYSTSQHNDCSWQEMRDISFHQVQHHHDVDQKPEQSQAVPAVPNEDTFVFNERSIDDTDPLMDEEVDNVDPDLLRSFESVVFANTGAVDPKGHEETKPEDFYCWK